MTTSQTDSGESMTRPEARSRSRLDLGGPPAAPGQKSREGRSGGKVNLSENERLISVAAGSAFALLGLWRRDLLGLAVAGVGGGLIYRGASGHCAVVEMIRGEEANRQDSPEAIARNGLSVSETLLINKSPRELYAYWRNFENLPRIMSHLESVRVIDEKRTHWVAKAPSPAGGRVEWDAEITRDEADTRIEWRSLQGADVPNFGAVTFDKAMGDRGTSVRVEIEYLPPGGQVGHLFSKMFGESPEHQVREGLRSFKRVMETGEVPTIEGQSRGTCTGHGKREGSRA